VKLDIICSTKKTVCVVFKPSSRGRWISNGFPAFTLNGCELSYVSTFRYLEHVINDVLNDDDDDIKAKLSTNMLISRCSLKVKLLLFKSYCMSLYDVAFWKYISVTVFNKFWSCYNKCIKKLFGYTRLDSTSRILINLSYS